MLTSCFLSGGGSPSSGGWIEVPQFTYTGQSETIVEEGIGWKIRFLTSGTFTMLKPDRMMIDAFLVGGGSGGADGLGIGGGGGGGGFTRTHFAQIEKDVPYEIVIGAGGAPKQDGGVTSALNFRAEGGHGAVGSVGGTGGNNGGNGISSGSGTAGASGGTPGQGTTTREFGEVVGEDYAGGGGGGGDNEGTSGTAGGNGGANGGDGGVYSNNYIARPGSSVPGKGGQGGQKADADGSNPAGGGGGGGNYGGGGGGGAYSHWKTNSAHGVGGAGGQGIVIIRNHRAKQATLSD